MSQENHQEEEFNFKGLKRVSPEKQEQIRKAALEGRIECAPQDKVSALEPWVDEVLEILGHSEALVTDESSVWDFFPFMDEDKEVEEEFEEFKSKLGFDVSIEDLIVDVASRLWTLRAEKGHAGYATAKDSD